MKAGRGANGKNGKKGNGLVKLNLDVCARTRKALSGIAEAERRSLRKTVSIIIENLVASGRAGEFLKTVVNG